MTLVSKNSQSLGNGELADCERTQQNAGDYALIVILSVLSSIATTPIPSSSLVLTVIIADSVGIPMTGVSVVAAKHLQAEDLVSKVFVCSN